MSVSASTQIPETSDPAVFQRQCKVLFEQVLKDLHIEEFGTSGQGQSGIDLLGRRRDMGTGHWVGVQCKLTIKAEKLKTGRGGVVEVEATRALAFQPELKELIIATTAKNDAVFQREAALFTDHQAKLGRDFTVQVWGWETLQAHILQHEPALKAFLPDAFPQTDRILRGQEKLTERVDGLSASQHAIATQQDSLQAILVRVEQYTAETAEIIARQSVWDERTVDTLLDRQIDQYRDMLKAGRPRTALNLLEGLWKSLPEGVEGRIRFRIRANTAACLLRLGQEKEAAEIYLEAYHHAASDPKAVPLKVLAHLLRDEPKEALAFGRTALAGDAEQGQLVAYLVTAAKLVPEEGNPLAIISDAVANDPFVAVAKIDYLRTHAEPGTWWEFAKESHARHPNDEHLSRAAAEAEIDRACHWSDANSRRPLKGETRSSVTEATSVLQALLEKGADSEAVWDDYRTSLSVNLAVGYRLLRQHDKAKEVISTALAQVPDDHALKQALLLVTLESGDYIAARQALEGMPESRDVVFGHLQVAANDGDWPAITKLAAEVDLSQFEADDRAVFEALTLFARTRLGEVEDIKAATAALVAKYAEEPIVPIIMHQAAIHMRDHVWAGELFQAAFQIRNRGNVAARLMLARLAEREDDPDKVIEILDGHIDVTEDSDDLKMLARAFVNATVRQSSVAFVKALPSELRSKPFYARVIGSIDYNRGDLPSAVTAFQQSLVADRSDVSAHLGLINTWLRQERRDLVEAHLAGIDLTALRGPGAEKKRDGCLDSRRRHRGDMAGRRDQTQIPSTLA